MSQVYFAQKAQRSQRNPSAASAISARNHLQLLFLLFFLPQNAIFAVGLEVWPQLETRHFLVIAEPTSQAEPVSLADWDAILGQLIEQLDAVYAPLFGGQTLASSQPPLGQKPILLLCADKASYLQRLMEYGITNPASAIGSGGYYHPDANIIFTWRQPTDYYSRHVVLHEVAHWYCLQLLGSRYTKMPLWFCEGLADHAAFHTWDGQTLHAIQLPRVTLENHPARLDALLKRLTQNDVAEELAPGSVSECFERLRTEQDADAVYDEYALAWGLAAFLMGEFPREMTQFFESLKQNDVSDSWQSAFEEEANQPTWSQFADWVAEHQHPWQWVWNHWEDTGPQLFGISDSTALIVQNPAYQSRCIDETTLLHCEATTLLDRTVLGLVFRYKSCECFEMLQFRKAGNGVTEWRHVCFAHHQWEVLSPWRQMRNGGDITNNHADVLEIRRTASPDGQRLQFFYNSHIVTEQADDPAAALPFGLAVQSGAAQFRVVIHD